MESTVNILRELGAKGVADIKADIASVSVTGKSAKKVRMVVSSPGKTVDKLIIYGPTYIETGRGPRKDTKESDFQDNMEEYVRIKFGISDNKKVKRLARFLRWRINKQGDKTHQKGGRKVYDNTIVKLSNDIKTAVAKDFKIKFSNFIKNAVNESIGS